MPLDITEVLEEGARRTLATNGLIITGALFFISSLNALIAASTSMRFYSSPLFHGGMGSMPQLFNVNPVTAGVLGLVLSIASVIVVIAGLRTFVSDRTEGIPQEYIERNLLMAILNLVVGGIVFSILVGIGLILLIIPGIYILVALIFWNVFVVIEDQNFIEGFQSSWELTEGNRLQLFGLGFLVMISVALINWVFSIPFLFGSMGSLSILLAQFGSSLGGAFTLATLAQAYNQLK